MSGDLRRHQSGASIFLTVALTDVGKRSLVERIGPLLDAVGATMPNGPFRSRLGSSFRPSARDLDAAGG